MEPSVNLYGCHGCRDGVKDLSQSEYLGTLLKWEPKQKKYTEFQCLLKSPGLGPFNYFVDAFF